MVRKVRTVSSCRSAVAVSSDKRGFMSGGAQTPVPSRVVSAALEGGFAAFGMTNTKGVCAYASYGKGLLAGASGCVVAVKRPDGSAQVGWTRSVSVSGPGAGVSGGFSMFRSNADDTGQLAGAGQDLTVGGYRGIGIEVNNEIALGARNSRGYQVDSVDIGVGMGLGLEAGVGVNRTWSEEFR